MSEQFLSCFQVSRIAHHKRSKRAPECVPAENRRLDSKSVGYWLDVISKSQRERNGLLPSLATRSIATSSKDVIVWRLEQ
jgi:hypothetical protein